jgi:hypothetical protein
MRYVVVVSSAIIVAVSAVLGSSVPTAFAAFHCMRIHAVQAGFAGNANVQYVELRMDSLGQALVSGHTIDFYDGSGALNATFTFPANVANSARGESILIATSEFNAYAQGGAADFAFSAANTTGADPLHPIKPNGKVVFAALNANCNLTAPVDSVAYGSVMGAASPDYGTAAVGLPTPPNSNVLRLGNLNTNPANNSAEYSLQPVATSSSMVTVANLPTDFSTPRNNGRVVLKLVAPAAVGGVAELPEAAGAAPVARTGGGGSRFDAMWYAAGSIALVAAMLAGGLAWRRRWHRA